MPINNGGPIMISINPQILEKNGKKEFVVLSYEDFLKMKEEIENYNDLRILRKAKQEEQDAPSVSFKEAKKILKIE
jgi:PHD/YefM family antitoxin component YafN of YafNO toxin-antitoxin module